MIEKEMAKFEKPDQDRLSSCLYPSFREQLLVLRQVGRFGAWRLHADG